jgi:hypothetical protein
MKPKIKKDTIFVSIASYRDPVCNSTLKSLLDNASEPKKIFIGICQQNDNKEDQDCLENYENNPNIKIIRIPYYEAKGPTYARYLCSTLCNGEEYFLQIDSHTKFVKNWDKKCKDMIKEIKDKGLSKKPVLSHYPKEIKDYDNYDQNSKKDTQSVPRMCKSFFNNRDMISFMGAEIIDTNGEYYQTPYVAGGMMFCESSFLDELPYDPDLPYLFVGEEILHSIRFYTNGWDIFTPKENIVFHEYTRSDKPKIWTDNTTYSDKNAFEKVKYYIGLYNNNSKISKDLKNNLKHYGLGSDRSLNDFYKYAGVITKNKIVKKNFCKKNNIATPEDIFNSNEKNHGKKFDKDEYDEKILPLLKDDTIENFEFLGLGKNKSITSIILGVIAIIIIIILIYFFLIKKNKKRR